MAVPKYQIGHTLKIALVNEWFGIAEGPASDIPEQALAMEHWWKLLGLVGMYAGHAEA